MTGLIAFSIGAMALIGLLLWLGGARRSRPEPAPEDDLETAVDQDELAAAERELIDDPDARPLDGPDDEDDWGPGTGR